MGRKTKYGGRGGVKRVGEKRVRKGAKILGTGERKEMKRKGKS